jgi:uncharacterized protein (UPF0332 family)
MLNQEIITPYLQSAHNELKGAQHNLDGGYFGIAVSRAYYAFLYAATGLLLTKDIFRTKHSAVLSAFREHFVKPGLIEAIFSDTFGEAFELRQIADYDMLSAASQEQANTVLSNAREFVDRIAEYLEKAGNP